MSAQISPTNAISYKGIFDQSIYDQSDCKDRTENGLIEHLKKKKSERLNLILTRNAKDRAQKLQDIINSGKGFWNKFVKPFIGIVLNLENVENQFLEITKADARKDLFKMLFEIELLEQGLDKEAVFELEKLYILKKPHIQSSELKEQIERALILAREEGIYLEMLRQFINNALSLPHTHLRIAESSVSSLKEDPFFKEFNSDLLNTLECIQSKLIVDSNESSNSETCLRSIYYFHGNPGTGKSTCIRKLAERLGLPYFSPPIRTVADLSSESLEGTDRTMMTQNPGLFAKVLLRKNNQGKSYLNGILVIDDFDKLLIGNEAEGGIPAALSFLLDYLDPEKRYYYCSYFQANIDISRLSIFITANKPIPSKALSEKDKPDPKDPSEKDKLDPFAALRSRVTEVSFPNFPEKTLEQMLQPFAKALVTKYKVDGFMKANGRSIDDLISQAITKQKECTVLLEPRDLKRQLEMIVAELRVFKVSSIKDVITKKPKNEEEEDQSELLLSFNNASNRNAGSAYPDLGLTSNSSRTQNYQSSIARFAGTASASQSSANTSSSDKEDRKYENKKK